MSKPGKFENMIKIIDLLSNNKTMKSIEIAEKLGVNQRTVFRYVSDINMGIAEFSNGVEAIVPSQDGYTLADSSLVDLLKSLDNNNALGILSNTPYGILIKEKFIRGKSNQTGYNEFVAGSKQLDISILKPLVDAVLRSKECSLDYRGVEGNIKIVPLKLADDHGINYVIGLDLSDRTIKLYAIDKILSVESGVVHSDKDLIKAKRDYINSAWGMMITNTISEVVFTADPSVMGYFATNPLHKSQSITGDQITLKIHNPKEFVRWIIRFGEHITITGGQEVKTALKDFLKKMSEKYNFN